MGQGCFLTLLSWSGMILGLEVFQRAFAIRKEGKFVTCPFTALSQGKEKPHKESKEPPCRLRPFRPCRISSIYLNAALETALNYKGTGVPHPHRAWGAGVLLNTLQTRLWWASSRHWKQYSNTARNHQDFSQCELQGFETSICKCCIQSSGLKFVQQPHSAFLARLCATTTTEKTQTKKQNQNYFPQGPGHFS